MGRPKNPQVSFNEIRFPLGGEEDFQYPSSSQLGIIGLIVTADLNEGFLSSSLSILTVKFSRKSTFGGLECLFKHRSFSTKFIQYRGKPRSSIKNQVSLHQKRIKSSLPNSLEKSTPKKAWSFPNHENVRSAQVVPCQRAGISVNPVKRTARTSWAVRRISRSLCTKYWRPWWIKSIFKIISTRIANNDLLTSLSRRDVSYNPEVSFCSLSPLVLYSNSMILDITKRKRSCRQETEWPVEQRLPIPLK